jgi:hypothetical protein
VSTLRRIGAVAFVSGMVAALAPEAHAQGSSATSQDQRYYDFWPGTWFELKDGARDTVATFTIRRGVHAAAFEEEWRLTIDSGRVSRSTGIRAWDEAAGRWMFVWVSDLGHFQVWDGVKVGEQWYIQRPFEQGGRRFISRQAWIPEGPDRVVRIMERSFDDGRTWQPRSRATFERAPR